MKDGDFVEGVKLGKILQLSRKKWERFKSEHPRHAAALEWCVVKELDDGILLIEQDRIDYVLSA